MNEYDGTSDEVWKEVEVVRPIEAGMGMEVVCPPVGWTSVVLWSLLELEAGCGHADKIVSAVRDD